MGAEGCDQNKDSNGTVSNGEIVRTQRDKKCVLQKIEIVLKS